VIATTGQAQDQRRGDQLINDELPTRPEAPAGTSGEQASACLHGFAWDGFGHDRSARRNAGPP
jgi:hypothetical protein